MKLLLLQPPIQDFYDTDIRLQPIGLAYLKAAVKKFLPHIEVIIKDFHRGWGRRTVPIPKELHYLTDYYAVHDKSPFSTFHAYYHFGADFDKIAKSVAEESPDLVGISSLFSPYYREVLKCAAAIKAKLDVPILVGGSHVSAVPELMLKDPHVDFVIRGEGEKPLVEFLKAFEREESYEPIPNFGFKKENRMIFNGMEENYPIEELPIPDLSDFDPQDYLFERKPLSFVITSRSCPHRCTFCSVHQTFGLRYRRRPIKSVLEEIEERYERGYRVFDFEDDNLTYYREEMKELCRNLIQRFGGKEIQFLAMNGISYLSLDDELLELMKQAGFTHLNLALVSSDLTVRETTKRPHTVEKYLAVVHKAADFGFKIVSYQILGLPNESLQSMIQTLTFNARLPVLLGASLFYMTPNSPIAKPYGTRAEEDIFLSRLTSMAIETDEFKREDLYTLFIITRIINFLKSDDRNPRREIGFEILNELLQTGILYQETPQGRIPNRKFKTALFRQVWNQLEEIGTQAASA